MTFMKVLAESGLVPGFDEKKRKLEAEDLGARKKPVSGWTGKPHDMERLAAAIEKLEEPDLIPVVKMILENKTPEMYIKTNVEGLTPLKFCSVLIE